MAWFRANHYLKSLSLNSSTRPKASLLAIFTPLLAATALAKVEMDEKRMPENCGIIGVVGTKPNANQVLLEGLTVLQNRGYDSAGMVTINPSSAAEENADTFVISKYANYYSFGKEKDSIARLRRSADKHRSNACGIAHTRWATQGQKIDANTHPHLDQKRRIALVHNGNILNAHDLRKKLHEHGIVFRSDTDSEVIAQLIGFYLDTNPTLDLLQATKLALSKLTGTWGIVALSIDNPNEMVVAQHGSPMVIGIGDEQTFVASEIDAFRRHTENIIELQDGEVALIRADSKLSLDRSRVRTADLQSRQVSPSSPAPWPHWTLREIEEQPDAIYRALNFGGRMTQFGVTMGGLSMQRSAMLSIDHLTIAASGSSMTASLYGAKLMRDLAAFQTVRAVDANSFSESHLGKSSGGLLAVSQSGETRAVLEAVQSSQQRRAPCFSVVNTVGSRISQTTKIGAYQNAGPEVAVTSTKSFSTQVTVLALIACWFAQHRSEQSENKRIMLMQALQRLPSSFKTALATRNECKEVAALLKDASSCFITGSGYAAPIAIESATKLKELAYLHARYWTTTEDEFPLALIQEKRKDVPFIFIIFDDSDKEMLLSMAKKLHRRGNPVIVITDNAKIAEGACVRALVVPSTGPLTALVALAPLQLIAYELAVLKGFNPDFPRNLSKTVKD